MVFELWEFDHGHCFLERDSDEAKYIAQLRQLDLAECNARHVWTVEAKTFNEGMQLLYDRKGWGRYRTMEEELGEVEGGTAEPGAQADPRRLAGS